MPTPDYAELMARAASHYRRGNFKQAESAYRSILRRAPGDAQARHNLGILLVGKGSLAAGTELLRLACVTEPANPQYWLSYGEALFRGGADDEAARALKEAVGRGADPEAAGALAGRFGTDLGGSIPRRADVAALYQAGHYDAAAAEARSALSRNHQDPVMWTILGAALQERGDVRGSLRPKIIAVTLDPGAAQPYNNLAFTQNQLSRPADGALSARRALSISPDYCVAQNNLGIACANLREWERARRHSLMSVILSPHRADYYSDLGRSLRGRRQWDGAEAAYRRSLILAPDNFDARNNRAALWRARHRTDAAIKETRTALVLKPGLIEAQHNLGFLACDQDRHEPALKHFSRTAGMAAGPLGFDGAAYRGVLEFLRGDFVSCRASLTRAELNASRFGTGSLPAKVYVNYLKALLPHSSTGHISGEPLIAIGESHSLALHHQPIEVGNRVLVGQAKWIPGCKQWHLANEEDNRFKRHLDMIVRKLPRGSLIVTAIGEIDSRADEGMFPLAHKPGSRPLSSLIDATTAGFVAWLRQRLDDRGFRVIVGGIPCPNRSLQLTSGTEAEYLDFVAGFNRVLRARSEAAGFAFLDLHALTDRGDGRADGRWHLDGHHLRPDGWREAFARHLSGLT